MLPNEKVSPQKAANLGVLYVMTPTYILFFGVMLYFFTDGFTALHLVIEEKNSITMMIIASLSAWLWWAFFVVKWKCWVIEHVDNLLVLESALNKKRMRYGLMDSIGTWEIASGATRDWYAKRYREIKSRKVEPQKIAMSIPEETIIRLDTQKIIRQLLRTTLTISAIVLVVYILSIMFAIQIFILGIGAFVFLIRTAPLLVYWFKSLQSYFFIVKLNERYIQFQDKKPIMWKNVAFVEFVEPYIYLKIRGNYIDDKLSYKEEDYDDVEFSFEMADYYDDGLTYEAQFPDKDPGTINLLLASYWTKGTMK